MADKPDNGSYLRTVDRALLILSSFTAQRPEWGVLELARELNLDKSQVQRNLATLAARGFVTVQPSTRRYRLGPALLGLGRLAEHSIGLDGSIGPALHALAESFRQSAVFNIPDGNRYRCAGAVDFPGPLRYTAAIGDLFPGHGGASGHAIFAYYSTDELRALFPDSLSHITSASITSLEALLERHAEVRARGVAISEGEYDERVMAIAAPVFAADSVIGSLSIAGSADVLREKVGAITNAVREAAAELSGQYRNTATPPTRP